MPAAQKRPAREPLRLPHVGARPAFLPTGLEERDHLCVHIGEPLDEDEVAGVILDPQPGAWDGPGEGRGVGDGDVAVLGAGDHERR